MVDTPKPVIAITMGDPCGIGPEVIAKALTLGSVYQTCRPLVVGSSWSMEQAVKLTGALLKVREVESPVEAGTSPGVVDVVDIHNLDPRDITVGKVSPTCGKAAMEWVSRAAELALDGQVSALATAPVNKEAASLAGYKSIGHMELLQEISGAQDVATMLMSGRLRVVHLTTHRSLRVACDYVTRDRILAKLELTHRSFGQWGIPSPRIGVAALNPHGSDGGLLGNEEAEQIAPAVEEARRNGINAYGPIPADVVFHQAIQGAYDVTLAMYHDQGHIPVKVHGFEESITANLGLPFLRTSVDHGTAFDIAGKGIAQHQSMLEAISLAVTLFLGKGLS
ncbi:MAG: 4-hydroxythreonine-4-phosphate dehydrogenase PdxA [Dehalococcoidia bacterium]|nr:4-hydroxythreonine-4-phosphate dehydrogenase PdxA [Dehalococcoidia bacterium]